MSAWTNSDNKKSPTAIGLKTRFAKFASYCAEGIEKNGVKPIFNWINLYAFGTGMTTAEADRLRIERYKQENVL